MPFAHNAWIFIISILIAGPLGPLEMSAALVRSSTIEIVWGPGEGDFTEYELIYTTPSSATVAIILQREINRHVLIDLQPGTMYEVTLSQLGGTVVESNTAQLTTSSFLPVCCFMEHILTNCRHSMVIFHRGFTRKRKKYYMSYKPRT